MMLQYFTEKDWMSFCNPDLISEAKLGLILNRLLKLGLRVPAEPTLKFIASFWMLVGMSRGDLDTQSPDQRHLMFCHVKKNC